MPPSTSASLTPMDGEESAVTQDTYSAPRLLLLALAAEIECAQPEAGSGIHHSNLYTRWNQSSSATSFGSLRPGSVRRPVNADPAPGDRRGADHRLLARPRRTGPEANSGAAQRRHRRGEHVSPTGLEGGFPPRARRPGAMRLALVAGHRTPRAAPEPRPSRASSPGARDSSDSSDYFSSAIRRTEDNWQTDRLNACSSFASGSARRLPSR